MTEALRVAAVQMKSSDVKIDNITRADRLVERAAGAGAAIVILPELWNVNGTDDCRRANAEALDEGGETIDTMANWARRYGITLIGGSISERREGREKLSNTCLVFAPSGDIVAIYRKIHIFDAEVGGHVYRESELNEPGEEIVLCNVGGWQIGLTICYDLRFPELYRILALNGADVLVVPSAFTFQTGRDHWEVLLRARAVENQCYVVAPNIWAMGGKGTVSCGRSMIVDPWGIVVAQAQDKDTVITADLDQSFMNGVRASLPSLRNRRPHSYRWPDSDTNAEALRRGRDSLIGAQKES
jgi:predicted amidohydrolase